jgi:OOP family OmpA-OmpF porin
MRKSLVFSAVAAAVLAGCATPGGMSGAELAECLQPNRRVVVEVGGRFVKPPAKPKPEAAKPDAAPKPQAAKPAPPAKPAKPAFVNVLDQAFAQGNSAFDPASAVLKEGGKAELDKLVASLQKRKVEVGSVIVTGHTDRLEAAEGNKALSEERAKAVKDYLVSKGLDEKLMFWEGKEAKDPVAVTKFCE